MSESVPESAPKKRWGWKRILLIAAIVLVPTMAFAGKRQWTYIKTDPKFCVSCHLMETPGQKWHLSAHKDVACQTCHRATLFEEAEMGFQGYVMRPSEVKKHAPLDIMICAECHISNDPKWKQIASTAGHREHFAKRGISCLNCHVTKLHEFKPDTAACTKCHGSSKLTAKNMGSLHCLGCHDFLNTKGGDLASIIPEPARCRTCHPAAASAEHPAMVIRMKGDPKAVTGTAIIDGGTITMHGGDAERLAHATVPGVAAPTAKGHENCLGCHDPHGPKLQDPVGCLGCHAKLLDASSKHYKDERLESCRDCHHPHKLDK